MMSTHIDTYQHQQEYLFKHNNSFYLNYYNNYLKYGEKLQIKFKNQSYKSTITMVILTCLKLIYGYGKDNAKYANMSAFRPVSIG